MEKAGFRCAQNFDVFIEKKLKKEMGFKKRKKKKTFMEENLKLVVLIEGSGILKSKTK